LKSSFLEIVFIHRHRHAWHVTVLQYNNIKSNNESPTIVSFEYTIVQFIPTLPSLSSFKDPPIYGEESGYRFFVLERMGDKISSAVPLLMKSNSSYETINIGPLAVKMLRCVQAIHETKNVIRDVKTDNFMLTIDSGTNSLNLESSLASRIRLIDLALATQWTTMYYETDDGGGLIGTPLYASLNLHAGKKTSFRDDLESLGYVIAEIVTQLYAKNPLKQLPWSREKSDKDIGSMKHSLVNNEKSEFYTELGNTKTIAVFRDYIKIIRGYNFKRIPDYDQLSAILSELTVPTKYSSILSSDCSTSLSKMSVSIKRSQNEASISNVNDSSPSKMRMGMVITRSLTKMNTNKHDESFDETVYVDARQHAEEMEWEYSVDENEQPKESRPPRNTRAQRCRALRNQRSNRSGKLAMGTTIDCGGEEKKKLEPTLRCIKRRGVSILFIGGPHEGESYEIEAGVNEVMVIGSEPSSKIGELLVLAKDKTLEATHVRLDLSITRKLTAIKVTDKSRGKTYVNRQSVKSTKAFINDTVKIGKTTFKVQPLI